MSRNVRNEGVEGPNSAARLALNCNWHDGGREAGCARDVRRSGRLALAPRLSQ
jgi:hypothetical protein